MDAVMTNSYFYFFKNRKPLFTNN